MYVYMHTQHTCVLTDMLTKAQMWWSEETLGEFVLASYHVNLEIPLLLYHNVGLNVHL